MEKTYENYLNEFINKHLKDESYGPHREHMINAFNEGFSCGAAWMLDLKESKN